MPVVEVLRGPVGMLALLHAVRDAAQVFDVKATTAIGIEEPVPHVILTIEQTSAALTPWEVRSLAAVLIEHSQAHDLEAFGRLLLKILTDMPGSRQGLH